MDDIVIEIKLRVSGLSYADAQYVRDALRKSDDISMAAIVDEVTMLAQEVAPDAQIKIFNPWAEWRPARGKRRGKPMSENTDE